MAQIIRTGGRPATHVHLVRNNADNGIEAFISSAGVALSIIGRLSPDRQGVLSSGDYDRLECFTYRNVEGEELAREAEALFTENGVHVRREVKGVVSDNPEGTGKYVHFKFDDSIFSAQVIMGFEKLNEKYPVVY